VWITTHALLHSVNLYSNWYSPDPPHSIAAAIKTGIDGNCGGSSTRSKEK
jgi:hypothetical protein